MVELVIKLKEEEYNNILKSDKTVFADAASKEAMMYAIKNGILISKKYDKTMDEIRNMNQIQVGKTYKMSGYDVVCIKQRKNGSYKMQTIGMTSGPWPGDGDISDYNDITKNFTTKWEGVISKFRLPKLTNKIAIHKGKIYKALVSAARDYCSFMSSFNNAWLGTVYGRNGAWCVGSGGDVYDNGYQSYSCVVAPSFLLDPSKIILDGDEIKIGRI